MHAVTAVKISAKSGHVTVTLQVELRQEHAQRVASQALVEQHKQQLADLKLEASILRQASTEHAR